MLYYIFKFICDLVRNHKLGGFFLILGAKDSRALCIRQYRTISARTRGLTTHRLCKAVMMEIDGTIQ